MSGLSIEAVIVGRNDEYEPNWEANLFAAIAYNRRLFEGSGIDYRVAFVEWNPLSDRPYLAPRLVDAFPFVRGIVVDPAVHESLCEVPELQMLLTFAFNTGFRTTSADFCLGSCGDIFYGSRLVDRIKAKGLAERCLYRAERANIRNDLPFDEATPDLIEDPNNLVSVDTCSDPPYDRPPYTNAAGDFSMLDAGTMVGMRGYDEGITYARLHIDARLGLTAMSAVDDCVLLGRIFHVSHSHSHTNPTSKTPGRIYDYTANLPYLNPPNWGLADCDWIETGPRLYDVRLPTAGKLRSIPDLLSPAIKERAASTTQRLIDVREGRQPDVPDETAVVERDVIGNVMPLVPGWDSEVEFVGDSLRIETGVQQWAYALMLSLEEDPIDAKDEPYRWAAVKLSVSRGAVGVGLLRESDLVVERFASPESGPTEVFVPLGHRKGGALLFRNIAEGGTRSVATIHSARIVSQARMAGARA